MTDNPPSSGPSSFGMITSGPVKNALRDRTLDFVRAELPNWRDDPTRPAEDAEERLNAQLCKYLNVVSRTKFPMVFFHHEEKQTAGRRVDISAGPVEAQNVGMVLHTIYDPFLVFEGKRLPPPAGQPLRVKEYLTGGAQRSGGMQRFKLGLHGAKHEVAALIGYVQQDTVTAWFNEINGWIAGFDALKDPAESWTLTEQLSNLVEDQERRVSACKSSHPRPTPEFTSPILLHHLWVQMA